MRATLVLVATPLGNLGDLSPRAQEALRNADIVACEDTRRSGLLLHHFGINSRLLAVHEHNEMESAERIVRHLDNGETVALISDAGMPAISDPGERVVRAVADAGHPVTVVPGPSAVPAALAVSGLPTARFCFEGFLPRKTGEAEVRLRALADEARTSVLYEAPHRLLATVELLAQHCGGDRRIVLVRELTKVHEEVWRGTCEEFAQRLRDEAVKGECVLVLDGAPVAAVDDDALREALAVERAAGASASKAASVVAEAFGVNKNRVYQLALEKR